MENLEIQVRETLGQIQIAQAEIERVRNQTNLLQKDLNREAHRLVSLTDVDNYSLRLLNTNNKISQSAIRALIEMSKDRDPVVRFKCINAFSLIPKYPDYFVEHLDPVVVTTVLQELSEDDPEHLIKLTARQILREFEDIFSQSGK